MLEISLINSKQHLQVQHDVANGGIAIGSSSDASTSISVQDDRIASRQMLLRMTEVDGRQCLEIENLGNPVLLPNGRRIYSGATHVQALPIKFQVGSTSFFVFESTAAQEPIDDSIRTLPRIGEAAAVKSAIDSVSIESLGIAPSSATLHQWFESFSRLQRSIAGSCEFFADAAHAAFDPGGLDAGMVLLREQQSAGDRSSEDDWQIAGSYIPDSDYGFSFRRSILDRMVQTRRTIFHDANHTWAESISAGQTVVVASPIFDEAGEVVGAVYGQRMNHAKNNRCGIRPLEAQFVQLIADSVAAGMVRIDREAEVARNKVMFEQVFSPKVATELQRNPGILDGHEREVTVLFTDLRDFTMIAERLGGKQTYHLLGDVMDYLTSHVIRQDGVIIDYFGDGLSAFWNAPFDQPNHPELACRAAMDMLTGFSQINDDWIPLVGHPVRLAIGIHTGPALVGNSGSNRRLKYGPRGSNVNIASRIEDATGSYHAPLLVSETTANRVRESLVTRRVVRANLRGVEKPVDLYQVFDSNIGKKRIESLRIYEQALKAYETSDMESAAKLLAKSEALHADPVAVYLSNLLISDSANAIVTGEQQAARRR